MRIKSILFMLLLLSPAVLFGYDILRGKPTDEASKGMVIILFTQIDSVDGRTIYGQRITAPDSMSVRDTVPWQITVTWARVDTLRGEVLALDTTTVQMNQRFIAGVLRPRTYPVDSAAVAADSVWKAGR